MLNKRQNSILKILGENQEIIVNYLATNYPPNKGGGRRAALIDIAWYELEDQ